MPPLHYLDQNKEEITMTIQIIKISEDVQDYLHCQYPGQTSPQECYLELDLEEETLTADYDAEIGGAVPFAVWHGRRRRFPIPALSATAVNALMEEVLPLAERIVAGSEIVWDGSNHIGQLDDDAVDAEAELDQICEKAFDDPRPGDLINAWDADDYFGQWTDEELGLAPGCDLAAIEAQLIAEHRYDEDLEGPLVIEKLEHFLQSRYESMMEELEND